MTAALQTLRGALYAQPRVWLSDMYRTRIDPLTVAKPHSGYVEFNEDRAIKRDAALDVINPHRLRPLRDYLFVELDVTESDGTQRSVPLGHFTVVPSTIVMAPTGITGRITGADMTYTLQEATIGATYVVPVGVDRGEAARDALLDFGIPPAMMNIPDAGVETTEELVFEEGDSWLSIPNKLLSGAGMYTLWTDGYGVLMSRHDQNIDTAPPEVQFGQRSHIRILGNLQGQPDWDRVRNRITYRRVTPGEPTIAATATVEDRSNPLHPETWREETGAHQPIIRGRTFDDVDLPEDPAVARIVAEVKARAELARRASYYLPIRMQGIVDPHPHGHQIIGVDAVYDDLNWSGNWWRRAWRVNFNGPSAAIDMDINRTITVQ